LVCVKRVPDSAENEIEVAGDGSDIERDDLVYSVNEWDNYAVEEAIQIVDKVGGSVTIVSVGDEDAEEVVRREMAMGANDGILLTDDAFEGSDGKGIATLLKAAVEKGNYDLPDRLAACWPPCWICPMLPLSTRLKSWMTKS
jgi:electron transfer flavoprotein beta subunit